MRARRSTARLLLRTASGWTTQVDSTRLTAVTGALRSHNGSWLPDGAWEVDIPTVAHALGERTGTVHHTMYDPSDPMDAPMSDNSEPHMAHADPYMAYRSSHQLSGPAPADHATQSTWPPF